MPPRGLRGPRGQDYTRPTMRRVLVSALAAAGLLTSSGEPAAPTRPAADASTREALDAALARERTASEYLLAGRRYRSLGLDRQAKEAVDRAARVATAASEWHGIAASFDALGYREAADEARRRAQNAPLR